MSEVLSGARYTFGALVVLTLWSIGMVQVAEWKLGRDVAELAAEQAEHRKAEHDARRRFGPGRD